MLLSDEPAYAPARGVEVLARRADCECELRKLGGEGGDTCERYVVEAIVNLPSQL